MPRQRPATTKRGVSRPKATPAARGGAKGALYKEKTSAAGRKTSDMKEKPMRAHVGTVCEIFIHFIINNRTSTACAERNTPEERRK